MKNDGELTSKLSKLIADRGSLIMASSCLSRFSILLSAPSDIFTLSWRQYEQWRAISTTFLVHIKDIRSSFKLSSSGPRQPPTRRPPKSTPGLSRIKQEKKIIHWEQLRLSKLPSKQSIKWLLETTERDQTSHPFKRAYRQWRDKVLILRGFSSRAFSGRPSPLLPASLLPPLVSSPPLPGAPDWLSLTSNLPQFINNAAVVQRRASFGVEQTHSCNTLNCDVKLNQCVLCVLCFS